MRSQWQGCGALPEPQAALLSGILLGDDSGLPGTTRDAFRETGMAYIIAISGQTEALVKTFRFTFVFFLTKRFIALIILLIVGADLGTVTLTRRGL